MGQMKQLHIDCYPGECYARGWEETCWQQPDNVSYSPPEDVEPTEPPEDTSEGDRDPAIDMEQE